MIKKILSSLKYRIAITVFIMEAIMLTIVLWNTFSFIEIQAKEDLDNRHQIIIELIKQITGNSIFSEEYDDLQQYIEQISQDPEIINIAILNKKGIIIAHSNFQMVGEKAASRPSSNHHYWIKQRLPKLGDIEVEFSLERIERQLRKAKRLGVGIAIAGMMIIAISGLMFGFLLTHKLGSLTKVIRHFKESGEYLNIEVSGSDEIATLSNAFNHMSNKINVYIEKIESDKNLLEVRVNERTQELEEAQHRLVNANEQLKTLAITDHLTGLYNRIKIEDRLEVEYLRYCRYKNIFSVILLDIDKFKMVNDTYGHDIGDITLVTTADTLTNNIRQIDTVGRWGGEEFIVVCPETEIEGASKLAEKLRMIIEKTTFNTIGNITCSFGVAEIQHTETIKNLLKRSDIALYYAKEEGRNRVTCAE